MPVLTVVPEDSTPGDGSTVRPSLIDEIVREGARRMLAAALEAEVDAYIAELADERDEGGRRLVVCNGHAQPGQVMTAAGAVEVTAPRVNDRRVDPDAGERQRFSSSTRRSIDLGPARLEGSGRLRDNRPMSIIFIFAGSIANGGTVSFRDSGECAGFWPAGGQMAWVSSANAAASSAGRSPI